MQYHASMAQPLCPALSHVRHPVVGMVHLLALPGAPRFGGDLSAVREAAIRDATSLAEGGVHGLMIENFGDAPFFKDHVPLHVATHMTELALAVRHAVALPLGVNVLRNDMRASLAVAHAAGASFIRVNVLSGAAVTDQGLIEGAAAQLLRDRVALGADSIKVWADVCVKHAAPVAPRPLREQVEELTCRAGAEAVIASGSGTGQPTDPDHVRQVKQHAADVPVLVGSGVCPATVRVLAEHADGFIVGTHFKEKGDPTRPVDARRVREIMSELE